MKRLLVFAPVLFFSFAMAQNPQPVQTQQQPCGTTASTRKPQIKMPSGMRKALDRFSPISSSEIEGSVNNNVGKASAPCPPVVSNTAIAPIIKLPSGVVTIWYCDPSVVANDAAHTQTYVMPDDIAAASPSQPNEFEADSAKPIAKAPTSCNSLRRDPKTGKIWLMK
jgi:hypothetical protein